jgi:hypothetical protein
VPDLWPDCWKERCQFAALIKAQHCEQLIPDPDLQFGYVRLGKVQVMGLKRWAWHDLNNSVKPRRAAPLFGKIGSQVTLLFPLH